MSEVRSFIKAGNKIGAIKLYREITGVGLAEAKEAVEKMVAERNAASAPTPAGLPANAPQKSGCLGAIALVAGSAGLVRWWLA
jgi:hypothetical protein